MDLITVGVQAWATDGTMASIILTVAALTFTVTTHFGVVATATYGTHLTYGTLPTAGATAGATTSHTAAGTMVGTTVGIMEITGITGDGEITLKAQQPHLIPSLNPGLQQLLEL